MRPSRWIVCDWDQLRGQPRIFKGRKPAGLCVDNELGPVCSRLGCSPKLQGLTSGPHLWSVGLQVALLQPSFHKAGDHPKGDQENQWLRPSSHIGPLPQN